ncbi:unnamed protein product [Leuciscus chuanchicus]
MCSRASEVNAAKGGPTEERREKQKPDRREGHYASNAPERDIHSAQPCHHHTDVGSDIALQLPCVASLQACWENAMGTRYCDILVHLQSQAERERKEKGIKGQQAVDSSMEELRLAATDTAKVDRLWIYQNEKNIIFTGYSCLPSAQQRSKWSCRRCANSVQNTVCVRESSPRSPSFNTAAGERTDKHEGAEKVRAGSQNGGKRHYKTLNGRVGQEEGWWSMAENGAA